mmetsp:Transcript_89268/g.171190  ORF Transcript_89268/g.171190 Transcript_89268/m.171190 type:complete len:451 (+) Transcript_89268:111-1463(+)
MNKIAFMIACMACVGHGHGLRISDEQVQASDNSSGSGALSSREHRSSIPVSCRSKSNSLKVCAMLLLAFNAASAFKPSGVRCFRGDPGCSAAIVDRLRLSYLQRFRDELTMSAGPPTGPSGGPPGAPTMGGPPPGVAGTAGGAPNGPPGAAGPPGGAPKGGPPPRTAAQQAVDKLFETVFPLLYAFEPQGMLDSEKNLRVLWVRALLAAAGRLDDDVAKQLLPRATRWVVSAPLARTVWAPVMPKLDWIKQRTEFIDKTLDDFLASAAASDPQVVLIGAGYDTRALRYRASGADFFEVDLPTVNDVKAKMVERFSSLSDDISSKTVTRTLGADLNKATMVAPGVFAQLEALGLSRERPTLVVIEAVLFYLSPPAKRALLADAGAFVSDAAGSAVVLTDNLAPFVRTPSADDAAAFLSPLGLSLQKHDSLWGGAIQFVRADAASGDAPHVG